MIKQTFSAGGVVVNRRGHVLVVNQRGNSWSLPKGHLEEWETPERAARREIFEESGVKRLRLIRELGTYVRPRIGKHGGDDRKELKFICMFLFRTDQMRLDPQDDDHPEARWVRPSLVAALLTHRKDRAFFRRMIPEVESLRSVLTRRRRVRAAVAKRSSRAMIRRRPRHSRR